MRSAWALIDLLALSDNIDVIRAEAGERRILAVLKANAYGHGLTRIAQALHDVDAIGVARLEEALELRTAGISRPIVLLEGFFADDQLPMLAASNIQPVIHHRWQVQAVLAAQNLPEPLKVWLKVDTGMHRLGVEPVEAERWFHALTNSENVAASPILMSHLACADEPEHSKNQEQLDYFASLVERLQPEATSVANSGALFARLGQNYDWVRPGLAMYGISPFLQTADCLSPRVKELRPVMTLCADLISTRDIKQGDSVGYGSAWTSSRNTRIGIVAIGYGDGYPRLAPEGTPVWIEGKRYPLVGRVAMDMVTVDLGPESTMEPGITAQLWGADLPVEEVAQHVGTVAYELLCNVARRVNLVY